MSMLYLEIRKTRYLDRVPKTDFFASMDSPAIAIGHFTETTEEYLAIPTEFPDRTFESVRHKVVIENHGKRVSVLRISEDDYHAVLRNFAAMEEAA